MRRIPRRIVRHADAPDLGDIVILLLAGTLSGLRDRLAEDGFDRAADLVGDLVEGVDGYLMQVLPEDGGRDPF